LLHHLGQYYFAPGTKSGIGLHGTHRAKTWTRITQARGHCTHGAHQIKVLETDDEYFPYAIGPRPQKGRWRIYGIFLPDDVLRKVYAENAARLIPGVR